MVSVNDTSLLRAIIDVLGFLVISIGFCLRAIIKQFVPQSIRKNCNGEIALITGAGSGIGRLVALRLAGLGCTIIVWDINESGIDETVKLIKSNGGKAYGYKCNIADREEVYRLAAQVTNDVGQVTILINNAGVVSGEFLLKTPDHLIQRTFDVNIVAHFWTTKAFLPNMIEKNHGHIVTIASMAGHVGIGKLIDYCSSKHAAVGFDEALRVELETQGIRGVKTLCVCPYFIQATGMFDDVFARFLPRLKSNDVADRIVLGIQREEVLIMLPGVFRYLFFLKWLLPWGVISMFLRNLVPDASPHSPSPTVETKKMSAINVKRNGNVVEQTIKQRIVERQP